MSKNSRLLASFTAYCREHPDERFWQALRNWSPYAFLYGSKEQIDDPRLIDTFYLEEDPLKHHV